MKFRSVLALGAAVLCCAPLRADSAPANPSMSAMPSPAMSSLTPSADDAAVLARYQLALDQLSTGSLASARVVLEDGIRRFGPRPDLNLLLGYVLQREGKSGAALERLSQTPASPLAAAFAAQLHGASATNATNAAVQASAPQIVPVAATLNVPSNAPSIAASVASLTQTDARLSKLEADMIEMVNAERAKAGLRALAPDERLASVARAHSAEMRDKSYFAHESPTTSLHEPMDRYQNALNDMPRVIAENIFRSWGSQRQVTINEIKEGHAALMKSPGHRANILYGDVTRIGVGVVANARGDVWITQMFLRP